MISVEDIIRINKQFDNGNLVNKSALEFAISSLKHTKDWITQLAYLTRAILIDHTFREGNKRTAAALLVSFFEIHKKQYDIYKTDKLIAKITKENVTDIGKIREMIKDVIG